MSLNLHYFLKEGVLTLRSSLDHLDISDKVRRESSKQADDNVDDEDDPGTEEPSGDVKPVTVRFAKSGVESEKFKKAREKSFEFQQQKAR
jgi:RPC5 protein